MKTNYKIEMVDELVEMIKKEGLRVFVAKSGTYGFYTDNEGKRVISFQVDLTISFSGNYKSKTNGTGWRILEGVPDNFTDLLNRHSPFEFEHYTTLEEHLETYQSSSNYIER